jgi:hypothetical protein
LVKESKVESMEMPKDFKGFAELIFESYFEVKTDGYSEWMGIFYIVNFFSDSKIMVAVFSKNVADL